MKTCMMHACVAAVLVLAAGCGKSGSGASGAPAASAVAEPGEGQTIAITGTPPSAAPSAAASTTAAPSASPSAATTPATAATIPSAKPAASAKSVPTTASAAPAKEVTPLKPASTRVSGKNFVLDAASPGCRVDTPCTMTLHLAASGEYHVNKEYPYKFTAEPAPGLQFLGNGDANTFSRASGDFREDGEKAATLTVRFKPGSAGEARVSGKYKMSVCSAENCQIETQSVTLAVPVM
jgi:hypothetical protein